MSRSESHGSEKLRADYDKITDKVTEYYHRKSINFDTLLKELSELELETSTKDRQQLFYILVHDSDKMSEDLVFLRRLAAIKCVLPKLTDPRHGALIDRDGHLIKSKVWHREPSHGGMNIFSSFFRIGYSSLNRISRLIKPIDSDFDASESEDESASNLIADLFLNFTKTSRKAVILKDILSDQNEMGFSALHQACHDRSQNLIRVIFDAIGQFIPPKDQKDVVLSLCKKTTKTGYTPLNSLCQDKYYEEIAVFFDAIKDAVPEKDLKKTIKKILLTSDEKVTPLSSACNSDSSQSIKALFDAVMLLNSEKDREKLTKKLLEKKILTDLPLPSFVSTDQKILLQQFLIQLPKLFVQKNKKNLLNHC